MERGSQGRGGRRRGAGGDAGSRLQMSSQNVTVEANLIHNVVFTVDSNGSDRKLENC